MLRYSMRCAVKESSDTGAFCSKRSFRKAKEQSFNLTCASKELRTKGRRGGGENLLEQSDGIEQRPGERVRWEVPRVPVFLCTRGLVQSRCTPKFLGFPATTFTPVGVSRDLAAGCCATISLGCHCSRVRVASKHNAVITHFELNLGPD